VPDNLELITCPECDGYKRWNRPRCKRCKGRRQRSNRPERAAALKAQGYTVEQIARRLGTNSPASVYVWLQRARERQHGAPA
jgi:transposase-like protein